MRDAKRIKTYLQQLKHLEDCAGSDKCDCGLDLVRGRIENYRVMALYNLRLEREVKKFEREYNRHIERLIYGLDETEATLAEGIARREMLDVVSKGMNYFKTRFWHD